MMSNRTFLLVLWISGLVFVSAHTQQQFGQPPQQQQQHVHQQQHQQHQTHQQQQGNMFDKAQVQDREHIKEHLEGVIQQPDTSKMSEQELQFHYFKMHDNDNNNKLDGTELIKSLIHWHVNEGQHNPDAGNAEPKIFTEDELCVLIDPIMESDDANKDGFIDYPEFVAAQAKLSARSQTAAT